MDNYFKFNNGNFPLILSVSHGGDILPEGVAIRKGGCHVQDARLVELAILIIDNFKNRYQKNPYYVINLVSRKIFDANRSLSEGVESAIAKDFWLYYHNKLDRFLRDSIDLYGGAFLIDLHGQSTVQAIELGYNLASSEINDMKKHTKYYNFSLNSLEGGPHDLVYGNTSFSNCLNKNGFITYPGTIKRVKPLYRTGGYILKEYTRRAGVSGVMVEVDRGSRINDISKTAYSITDSIYEFMNLHF